MYTYGITSSSLQDIDNNAIDGFLKGFVTIDVDEPTVNLDLNSDGDKIDLAVPTTVFIFKKNPAGLDILEQIVNY